MMAAAQAAAEAALREAEEHGNMSHRHSEEPSDAALAALLQQAAEHGDYQQFIAATMANPDEGEDVQYLLQMMAQQEQQRQQLAAFAAIASRPLEHYISIAQNGAFMSSICYKPIQCSGLIRVFLLFLLRDDSGSYRNCNRYPA